MAKAGANIHYFKTLSLNLHEFYIKNCVVEIQSDIDKGNYVHFKSGESIIQVIPTLKAQTDYSYKLTLF